nr:VRR-NUC domain-containing protein [uncultured Lachnoanaerobaculum sp.]
MLEKEVEKFLVREVKKIGGVSFKFISPGNAGVPDRIVILPTGKVVFVELKTDKGKLTKLQEVQIKKISNLGADARVLRGIEGVKEFINEIQST